MIAAIEWIPVGRANPTPTKYEYSRAEQEFLARMQAGDLGPAGDGDDAGVDAESEDDDAAAGASPDAAADADDEEWEDAESAAGEGAAAEPPKVELPTVDPDSLPADLRMDEYSDDEGDQEKAIGGLLVGQDAELMGGATPFALMGSGNNGDGDDESSDSEDEDDLADIPDTREFMPVDVEGLQSLGIGGGGGGPPAGGPGGAGGDGGYTMADLQNMTMNDLERLDDDDEDDEDDEDEANDVRLHENDALVVVAKTEEDYASLEINVFDTRENNLYVHHDIPLPAFPLCFALGSVVAAPAGEGGGGGGAAGSYVAVGSFDPGIEVWNLDVMNALEPTVVLGGADTRGAEDRWLAGGGGGGKKKKKKGKARAPSRSDAGLREGSHTDAVMALSWNAVHAQVLASGSADGTVKLWDVTQASDTYVRPSATLTHHTDKVASLAWHPSEGTLLATGGYDRRVCLVDARSADGSNVKKAKLAADCEALAWDPHRPQYLTVASEDGVVKCLDVRKFGAEPAWSMVAHEYGGVSDICYNAQVPGMLVTCSIDKTVALWDTGAAGAPSAAPQPCGSKDMNVGKLYSVACYPSAPWLLACGGSGNELAIWDMEGEDAIRKRFAGRGGDAEARAPVAGDDEGREPDFEAAMDDGAATSKALEGMQKSKKKKGKKKGKAHKKK